MTPHFILEYEPNSPYGITRLLWIKIVHIYINAHTGGRMRITEMLRSERNEDRNRSRRPARRRGKLRLVMR